MPTITITTTTTAVNPGDLITAELMNEILQRLEALENATVSVPDVSKHTLEDAKSMIEIGRKLQLGLVFFNDAEGNLKIAGPVVSDSGNLEILRLARKGSTAALVTGQVPQPGTSVSPGSLVHLFIS
jgi:hypothetical protein